MMWKIFDQKPNEDEQMWHGMYSQLLTHIDLNVDSCFFSAITITRDTDKYERETPFPDRLAEEQISSDLFVILKDNFFWSTKRPAQISKYV